MIDNDAMHAGVDELVRLAVAEDIGSGDVTTGLLVPADARGRATVRAKQGLVSAGYLPFQKVFQLLSAEVTCTFLIAEGAQAAAGDLIAELAGPYSVLLTGERTALNFLQHLCGIATATREFVNKIKPFGTVLLDTRKTLPGWRLLEKAAVRLGGGANHRMGLYDAILIKENHIAACGGIRPAIQKARQHGRALKIEIEVRNLEELQEALQCAPDIIMLDNMSCDDMRRAVALSAGRVPLEASGNVTLETIEQIAATGVTFISAGAITHSARAADLSMIIEPL
jgi:nicotinate-nucleotide pyrophosphorylase (carboxylating)